MTPCLFVAIALAGDPLPAFPGAEGFGAHTPGGRGGRVLFVDNLQDSGPGSLRAACDAKGPRIVLFRVSGVVDLQSPLRIREPFLTIAGQTAPGAGVCLKRHACVVATHDVVVRFLRFRPGDEAQREMDALSVSGRNVVVDHCSASWSIDETLSVTNSDRVTVQWCFITESLNDSFHKKGPHGYGSLITGPEGGVAFHHNLYAHHNSRNPRPGGKDEREGLVVDFRNNVVYNWGSRAGYSGETAVRVNYVGNFLRPGPSSRNVEEHCAFLVGGTATRMYLSGNVFEGFAPPDADDARLLRLSRSFAFPDGYTVRDACAPTPFEAPRVSTDEARAAFERVLARAGAILPRRDAADARIVRDVRERTGRIVDSHSEVGGWPEYPSEPPPKDADEDGMPDGWEIAHGLDPLSAADAQLDRNGDGYTNIEEYVNSLVDECERR